jgi:preprotein translocase subunit YajC
MDVLLAQDGGGGGSLLPLLMIVALFAIFYFVLIRPQQRRRREVMQTQASLTEGDQVVTIGGLHGTIAELDDRTVILETAEGVFARYERGAIARVVSPEETRSERDSDSGSVEQRDKD